MNHIKIQWDFKSNKNHNGNVEDQTQINKKIKEIISNINIKREIKRLNFIKMNNLIPMKIRIIMEIKDIMQIIKWYHNKEVIMTNLIINNPPICLSNIKITIIINKIIINNNNNLINKVICFLKWLKDSLKRDSWKLLCNVWLMNNKEIHNNLIIMILLT